MQSAAQLAETSTLVPAEQLREMTITKEDLAKKQKLGVLEQLMETMVRVATESGGREYAANLNPQFDPSLLAEIVKELQDLGYTVTTEAKSDPKMTFIQIKIVW